MASDQANRASDRDRERAGSAGSAMRGNVSRRLITSTDEFPDASRKAWRGSFRLWCDLGVIHAELTRAHLGCLVADAAYCSVPLAFRGETVADRVWLVAPHDPDWQRASEWRTTNTGEPPRLRRLGRGGGRERSTPSVRHAHLLRRAHLNGQRPHLVSNRTLPVKASSGLLLVVDGGRLSRAFDLLSGTVNHHKDAALTKVEAETVLNRPSSRSRCARWPGDSSRSLLRFDLLASTQLGRSLVPARDYARKWRYQNVTLADLCEASGVSERRVRSAFHECYQKSPTAYLRVHRAHRGTARTRRRTAPTRCR